MNDAQQNYTMTEKEFLVVVFALEKFQPYLLGLKMVIFTDHSALKYLMFKKEAKTRLIWWILLLQEFDLEIWDKRDIENVVADHRLWIPNAPIIQAPINEDFPDEHILAIFKKPWYANIVKYLATGKIPIDWIKQEQYCLFAQVWYFFWEEPYLFKYYPDQIIRRCITEEEQRSVLSFYHNLACGGYFGPHKTAKKVLQSRFYWHTLFKASYHFY